MLVCVCVCVCVWITFGLQLSSWHQPRSVTSCLCFLSLAPLRLSEPQSTSLREEGRGCYYLLLKQLHLNGKVSPLSHSNIHCVCHVSVEKTKLHDGNSFPFSWSYYTSPIKQRLHWHAPEHNYSAYVLYTRWMSPKRTTLISAGAGIP